MELKNIMNLHGVKTAKYLPSDDLLRRSSEKINFKMGALLHDYLSNCGYIEFSFVEIFGITENKGMESDLITKTIFLNEKYPQTTGYVVLEDKGDGDYILCDEKDSVFEFIPTFKLELMPLEYDLLSYLTNRYNEIQ